MQKRGLLLPILMFVSMFGRASDPIQDSHSRAEVVVIQPLSFGGVLVNPAGGTLSLNYDGTLIPEGGVSRGSQPAAAEARIRLTGPAKADFELQVDPTLPILSGPSGANLRVSELFCSLPGFRGTFDATGLCECKLGARLQIPTNAPTGWYRASTVMLRLKVSGSSNSNGGIAKAAITFSVLLRAPLILTNHSDLNFGVLVPGGQSCIFEVLPEGGYRVNGSGGAVLLKGAPHPAAFSLRGPAGASYSIQLPSSIQLVGPGRSMRVQGFKINTPLSGVLPSAGVDFNVGAGLQVEPGQTRGEYRGLFVVSVNYP